MEISPSRKEPAGHGAQRPDRETLRERERKSREKRALMLEQQRATLELYESVVAVIPSLFDDDNALWDSVLEPDEARVRTHLRRSLALAQERRQLEADRSQLNRLFQEHRLASIAIEGLLGAPRDDWEARILRWRSITRRHFKAKTMEDCKEEIEAAWREMNAFLWGLDTTSVGVTFFGWRVRRRIVESRDAVQFSFDKTLRGFPMMDFVNAWWDCYTKTSMYDKTVIGKRGRGWVDVLQELTPEMCVVRVIDWYPSISLYAHMIYLVSRVKTEYGYYQFVRTLYVPEVQNKISEHTDMWASNFVWLSFEALNEDATDYRAHIGGKLSGRDANYAAEWLMETLGVLLRVEQFAAKRGLLSNY